MYAPTEERGPTERLPEEPPATNPVPVQEVALFELQEIVEGCPWSTVAGEAEKLVMTARAGGNALQFIGLVAPFIHTSEPSGLPEPPPVPVHPVGGGLPLQATHDLP